MATDRRTFLQVTAAAVVAGSKSLPTAAAATRPPVLSPARLRLDVNPTHASIPFLSWDTEGGDRAQRNLLRSGPGVTLRVKDGDAWREALDLPARQHAKD